LVQEAIAMAARAAQKPKVPAFVGRFNPIAQGMLGVGIPLGPNALLTVRGRTSGEPRTTPVALIEIAGSRWVVGTFGETHWVRNLRAARRATLAVGRRRQQVEAVELDEAAGGAFFRDVLGPYVRRLPLGAWMIGSVLGARDILEDPLGAAGRHPVFELRGLLS
jgi:deazaflavin-dependent oxidoreductase (nitroreductase family)